jgi:hypothetical protein
MTAKRLERAEPGRRQIARDAAHAHAILPVRRDRDVDHRIVEPGIVRKGVPTGASAGSSMMPS